MELFAAHKQWSNRPADERFASVQSLHEFCASKRSRSRESGASFALDAIRAKESQQGGILLLDHATSEGLVPTNWAFGQVSRLVGAPPEYLATLPVSTAVLALNHGLAKAEQQVQALVGVDGNGDQLRALTGKAYSRIWDADITSRLMELAADGWAVPPSADKSQPAGLYASDRDMFAFMTREDRVVANGARPLVKGFYVSNSEVGALSFAMTGFLCDRVCGNHIVWGARDVTEIKIRHVGQNVSDRAFSEMRGELTRYANESTSELEAKIDASKIFELGKDKDAVLDRLFGLRMGLSRKVLDAGYTAVEQQPTLVGASNPRSAWGMVQGLTYVSQAQNYASERVSIDRAAGKVLELVS